METQRLDVRGMRKPAKHPHVFRIFDSLAVARVDNSNRPGSARARTVHDARSGRVVSRVLVLVDASQHWRTGLWSRAGRACSADGLSWSRAACRRPAWEDLGRGDRW